MERSAFKPEKPIEFESKYLAQFFWASFLIVLGVVIGNGSKQFTAAVGETDQAWTWKALGAMIFIVGWIRMNLTMLDRADGRNGQWILLAGKIMAPIGALGWRWSRYRSDVHWTVKNLFLLLFITGWILIMVGLVTLTELWDGVIPPTLTLIATLLIMPWQRKHCVVDGLGLVLFTISWVYLSMILSVRIDS